MSDVEALSDELATVTDEYADAIGLTGDAENRYQHAYYVEFLKLGAAPATTRGKLAESACVDERAIWTTRQAMERALRAKVMSLQARLVAAQSTQKYFGKQDGGVW